MKLSEADIESLTADPVKVELGMPTLAEIDHALFLIRKRYPVDAWYTRWLLKGLCKKMDKHYGVKWTTPWEK